MLTYAITSSQAILDSLPEAVLWALPVFDASGTPQDFRIAYSNKEAAKHSTHLKGTLTGKRVLQDGIPSCRGAGIMFAHLLEVYQTRVSKDCTLPASISGRHAQTCFRRYEEGVLSTIRHLSTQRNHRELEDQKMKSTLEAIVRHSPCGIVVYDAIRDARGRISDFRHRLCNQRCNELTGCTSSEREECSFRQILRDQGAGHFFDRYAEVVETGKPFRREQWVEQQNRWLSISVVKLGNGFLSLVTDITALKTSQQGLRAQTGYLHSILNTSLNAVVTLQAVRDKTGNLSDLVYRQVNTRFLQWFAKTEEEVIGHTMLQTFPATGPSGIMDMYRQVIETGTPKRTAVRYQDGAADIWLDISAAKLQNDSIVATFNDITENKKAQEEVEQQKNLLDNILHYSTNGISVSEVILNAEGQMIDMRAVLTNDATLKATGLSREKYLSLLASELDPNFTDSSFLRMCRQTLQTGAPFFLRYFLQSTRKWLELTVSKMGDNHLIHIFTDVTLVKEAELQLDATVEELRRSNAHLAEFAYVASHDLKEPLRKINAFASRLQQELSDSLSPAQQQLFDRMLSATARMRALIEDLLAYSQISAHTSAFSPVDLNTVVLQVVSDLETSITETGATLHIAPLPEVRGDERQMRQLFQNLIGNALKYRHKEVPPQITLTATLVSGSDVAVRDQPEGAAGTYHLIEVADNGIGFEQQYAEQIFKVFQRLHGRLEYEGTGVGLAIVQKVVANHSGFVSARSEPGNGATFRILLPQ